MDDAASGFPLHAARHIAAPPPAVWRAWTEAALLRRWWAPRPVETVDSVVEPRPGGRLFALMRLPDGVEVRTEAVFLDLVEARRVVFTDALTAGWHPSPAPFITCIATLAPRDGGTDYAVTVLHRDAAARARHEAMGFNTAFPVVLDQLADTAVRIAQGDIP